MSIPFPSDALTAPVPFLTGHAKVVVHGGFAKVTFGSDILVVWLNPYITTV